MKLQDYMKRPRTVTPMAVDYKDETLQFHIRELTAGDRETLAEIHHYFLTLRKDTPDGEQINMDATGLRTMYQLRTQTLAMSLCDEDGDRLYKDEDEVRDSFPSKLCDAIYEAIQEHHKDDAAGNSEGLTV
jgi:hypothetical protein